MVDYIKNCDGSNCKQCRNCNETHDTKYYEEIKELVSKEHK